MFCVLFKKFFCAFSQIVHLLSTIAGSWCESWSLNCIFLHNNLCFLSFSFWPSSDLDSQCGLLFTSAIVILRSSKQDYQDVVFGSFRFCLYWKLYLTFFIISVDVWNIPGFKFLFGIGGGYFLGVSTGP